MSLVNARGTEMLKILKKSQNEVLNYENCDSNMILLCEFNARTGESEDFVELDNEHNEVPSRRNRDKIINTNGRCLLDLCKTTEMSIVNGRIGSDKGIGEFTCITHNGKSLIDYFIIDSSSLNLIKDNFRLSMNVYLMCIVQL